MQLSSSEPCVVILTEKEVEVSVNNHATFTLPKNYLAASRATITSLNSQR